MASPTEVSLSTGCVTREAHTTEAACTQLPLQSPLFLWPIIAGGLCDTGSRSGTFQGLDAMLPEHQETSQMLCVLLHKETLNRYSFTLKGTPRPRTTGPQTFPYHGNSVCKVTGRPQPGRGVSPEGLRVGTSLGRRRLSHNRQAASGCPLGQREEAAPLPVSSHSPCAGICFSLFWQRHHP